MTESDESSKPILDIDLGVNGGKLDFYTTAEVEAWIDREVKAWGWISDAISRDTNLNSLISTHWSNIQAIAGQAKALSGAKPSSPEFQQAIATTRKRFRQYQQSNAVNSNTPVGQLVLDLAVTDVTLAGYALAALSGHAFIQGNRQSAEASFLVLRFLHGDKPNEKPYSNALNLLHDEWRQKLIDLNKEIRDEFEESARWRREQVQRLEEKVGQTNQLLQDGLKAAQDEIKAITHTYDQLLALQKPVKYWKDKATRHRRLFWGFGIVSAVYSVALIIVVFSVLMALYSKGNGVGVRVLDINVPLLLQFSQGTDEMESSKSGDAQGFEKVSGAEEAHEVRLVDQPPLAKLSIVLLLTGLGFYPLTVFIRLTLSHQRLLNDADERATMMNAYLALIRHENAPQHEDLSLILAALFRNGPDGLGKDDGAGMSMSPTLLTALLSRFSRQGGQ